MSNSNEDGTNQKQWTVRSGSLHSYVLGTSAEEAMLSAIASEEPEALGEIISALEDGMPPIDARLFHTETLLRKHNLWADEVAISIEADDEVETLI